MPGKRLKNIRTDTEAGNQEMLFAWSFYQLQRYPELELLYHIPNGDKRDAKTGIALKRQGVKAGVPDLHLPVARGEYNSLYIELKVGKNKTTKAQDKWIEKLRQQGNKVIICYTWQQAAEEIIDYLDSDNRPFI